MPTPTQLHAPLDMFRTLAQMSKRVPAHTHAQRQDLQCFQLCQSRECAPVYRHYVVVMEIPGGIERGSEMMQHHPPPTGELGPVHQLMQFVLERHTATELVGRCGSMGGVGVWSH